MPNDAAQLFLGVAVLVLLALSLGMLSARLFMFASRGSDPASRSLGRRRDDSSRTGYDR
jgi:hypothetical protein